MFIYSLCGKLDEFHVLAVIVLEMFLIRQIFYLENRAGIMDFLRILPIKEWKKVCIKAGVGKCVILGICAVFGLTGTIVNVILNPKITMLNELVQNAGTIGNSYVMLWQIVLIIFLVQ